MQLTAHRGFAAEHPENTLTAVRAAARTADEIEVDVRRCGSGELVVFHDDTLDRVTDGEGFVSDHSIDELRALSVLGSDEGIPSLREILDVLPPDVTLNAELKEEGVAEDAAALAHDVDRPVLFSSFLPEAIDRVSAVSECPTALVFDDRPTENVSLAADLGCERVHPHWWLALRTRVIERASETDLEVHAWTIRHRTTARILRRRGVDGVIADIPIGVSGVRSRRERTDGI